MDERSAFDQADDQAQLLSHLMFGPGGPRPRAVALEHLQSLSAFGLAQLRAEIRAHIREAQRARHADTYNPWTRPD
jgi:hypothetical protein